MNCQISFTLVLKRPFWSLELSTFLVMVVKNKTTYLTKHLTKISFYPLVNSSRITKDLTIQDLEKTIHEEHFTC